MTDPHQYGICRIEPVNENHRHIKHFQTHLNKKRVYSSVGIDSVVLGLHLGLDDLTLSASRNKQDTVVILCCISWTVQGGECMRCQVFTAFLEKTAVDAKKATTWVSAPTWSQDQKTLAYHRFIYDHSFVTVPEESPWATLTPEPRGLLTLTIPTRVQEPWGQSISGDSWRANASTISEALPRQKETEREEKGRSICVCSENKGRVGGCCFVLGWATWIYSWASCSFYRWRPCWSTFPSGNRWSSLSENSQESDPQFPEWAPALRNAAEVPWLALHPFPPLCAATLCAGPIFKLSQFASKPTDRIPHRKLNTHCIW